ncbi:MAG: DUF192 domain-containing protein [Polyangiaceae bacterium]|nr:DUF192 domain-containing protein [Polyangiaceae bacterium]
MQLAAWIVLAGVVGFSIAACDRVPEPIAADPHPLTTTPSATQSSAARCIKAWGTKPQREPFVAGFVAPDCPEKGDKITPPPPKDPLRTATAIFEDAKSGGSAPSITVEVAETETTRQRGLMMRKSMPENRGMIFVFEQRRVHEFWMHNTCIPLDMMFVDKDGFITGIEENVPTMNDNTYTSGCPALYVIEVNAGWSRAHGVMPGQKVRIEGL